MSEATPAHIADEQALLRLIVSAIITFCARAKLLPPGVLAPALRDLVVGTAEEAIDHFYDTLGVVSIVARPEEA